ncbi:MAG: hypothetical protein ACK4NY_04785 [Spirosomataceae bacterium]
MKLVEALFAFGAFGFLTIWVDQFVYKGSTLSNSYHFLMFGLASFMCYLYFRGKRILKENQGKQQNQPPQKKKK